MLFVGLTWNHSGLFAWLSVNFLRGTLGQESAATAGILDLGGGSVQIALAHDKNVTVGAIRQFNIFNRNYRLFIKRYYYIQTSLIRNLCYGHISRM
eukprot:m.168610 g.168610  ORF g.168610 m.168610 type:complete len:96 (+) comp38962_c2_seq2:170-457(+)